MKNNQRRQLKSEFHRLLSDFIEGLAGHISGDDEQWTIKGFIDIFKNIYTISADTKVVSKILEIHIFPEILKFAETNGYRLVVPDYQNYYPDISFVSKRDETVKFAVDFKTSYRLSGNPDYCNGFTLGSHGEYFIERTSRKNIQFPYNEYLGHFCLGIIYSRATPVDNAIAETRVYPIRDLRSITSVVNDFLFFVCEKWQVASDTSGSGNTANIGSIKNIKDILDCNGMFKHLGEEVFDDYWMNYKKIMVKTVDGTPRPITKLKDFLEYRGLDVGLINPRPKRNRQKVLIAPDADAPSKISRRAKRKN